MSFLNCVIPLSLRRFRAVIALSLLFVIAPAQATAPLVLHSKAVLVVNQRTGKTLFQKQANRVLPIADQADDRYGGAGQPPSAGQ